MLATLLAWGSAAGAAEVRSPSLAHLTLEELSNLQITSVSKRPERLADAPTSVFVLTSEDIRRSGAATLPEVLRLVPNLHVARASATSYSISARGLSDTAANTANKLLVLIDGRSVYTPLFSGVFWDVQHVVLEDVERIEVISGPGGTLWGLNAVNGVINVITRSAAQTPDALLVGGAGTRDSVATLRAGGFGPESGLRLFAQHLRRPATETADGIGIDDAAHDTLVGLRGDWESGRGKFTLLSQAYTGRHDQPLPGTIAITGLTVALDTVEVAGGHVLGRWVHTLDNDDSIEVQAYYDRSERVVPPTFGEKLNIFDLQAQHSMRWNSQNTLVWGAQYRLAADRVANTPLVEFLPPRVEQEWISLFAQGELAFAEDWRLTLGARVEHNDYTGAEVLPNLRLAWKPADQHLVWSALSRAVRAPSRLDRDVFVPWPASFPNPGGEPYLLAGGPNVRSETADVLELGYRGQPTSDSTLSATVFHARYDHLRTQEFASDGFYLIYANGMEGTVSGVELRARWQATRNWQLQAGVDRLWEDLQLKPGSTDLINLAKVDGNSPDLRWLLRSTLDLPNRMELDATLRHVSKLTAPDVPAYTAFDLRWGWRINPQWELSVLGQDLFDSHGEFTDRATRTEWGPALFVKLVGRY